MDDLIVGAIVGGALVNAESSCMVGLFVRFNACTTIDGVDVGGTLVVVVFKAFGGVGLTVGELKIVCATVAVGVGNDGVVVGAEVVALTVAKSRSAIVEVLVTLAVSVRLL